MADVANLVGKISISFGKNDLNNLKRFKAELKEIAGLVKQVSAPLVAKVRNAALTEEQRAQKKAEKNRERAQKRQEREQYKRKQQQIRDANRVATDFTKLELKQLKAADKAQKDKNDSILRGLLYRANLEVKIQDALAKKQKKQRDAELRDKMRRANDEIKLESRQFRERQRMQQQAQREAARAAARAANQRAFSGFSAGQIAGGVGAGVAAKSFFQGAVTANRNLERNIFVLRTAMGSVEEADAALAKIRQTVRDFSTDLDPAIKGFAQLAAATRGTEFAGKQTMDLFEAISAQAAVTGATIDDYHGVFRAIRQIATKGKAQAEEITGQLGERIPGAIELMAKGMGKTKQELFALMDKGLLPAEKALSALTKAIQESGAIEAARQRNEQLSGQLSQLSTDIQEMFTGGADSGNNFLKFLIESVKVIRELVRLAGPFFNGLGYLLNLAITPLKILVGLTSQLNANFLAIATSLGAIALLSKLGAFGKLAGMLAKFSIVGRVAGAIGKKNQVPDDFVGPMLPQKTFFGKMSAGAAGVALVVLTKMLGDLVELFKGFYLPLSTFKAAFPILGAGLEWVTEKVREFGNLFYEVFIRSNVFELFALILKQWMARGLNAILDVIIDLIKGFLAFKGMITSAVDAVAKFIAGLNPFGGDPRDPKVQRRASAYPGHLPYAPLIAPNMASAGNITIQNNITTEARPGAIVQGVAGLMSKSLPQIQSAMAV